MVHPRVIQLRFARTELLRGLADVSQEDAVRRILPMNCLSWIVGHLASQEQRYWLQRGQGMMLLPALDNLVGFGRPPRTPPLDGMWDAWRRVTQASDAFLDAQTTPSLRECVIDEGEPLSSVVEDGRKAFVTWGSLLQRVTYHYWYHIGEALAIRQLLGHTDLPDFVGDIELEAPYTAEPVA